MPGRFGSPMVGCWDLGPGGTNRVSGAGSVLVAGLRTNRGALAIFLDRAECTVKERAQFSISEALFSKGLLYFV